MIFRHTLRLIAWMWLQKQKIPICNITYSDERSYIKHKICGNCLKNDYKNCDCRKVPRRVITSSAQPDTVTFAWSQPHTKSCEIATIFESERNIHDGKNFDWFLSRRFSCHIRNVSIVEHKNWSTCNRKSWKRPTNHQPKRLRTNVDPGGEKLHQATPTSTLLRIKTSNM